MNNFMNNLRSVFILLNALFLFGNNEAIAQKKKSIRKNQFLEFTYVTPEKDRLANIYNRFIKKNQIYVEKSDDVHMIKTKSPKIADWENIPKGSRILLYINCKKVDIKKVIKYKKLLKKEKKKNYNLNAFYMMSLGSFNHTKTSVGTANFSLNSPVSIGLSGGYRPKDKKHSYSGSMYWTNLKAVVQKGRTSKQEPPSEIGLNAYLNYPIKIKSYGFEGYAGIDYENFSTFDFDLLQRSTIFFDEHFITFLTIGHNKVITILGQRFFTKFSLSRSLFSSTKAQSEASDGYSGWKYLLYLNKSLYKKFFIHGMFKQHILSNESYKLDVKRFGLGFGMNF
jgi:hypothetical protein